MKNMGARELMPCKQSTALIREDRTMIGMYIAKNGNAAVVNQFNIIRERNYLVN